LFNLFVKIPSDHINSPDRLRFYPILVLFCGTAHFGYRVDYPFRCSLESTYEYDIDKIESIIKEYDPKSYNSFTHPFRYCKTRYHWFSFSKPKLLEAKEKFRQESHNDLLIEHDTPIISVSNYYNKLKIQIDPNLKELEFYKEVDPFNAYQNIFSFVSGVLTTKGKTIPEISNDNKIQKSGFDKWSFRKEPTK
jgi:hypothetical protein